MDLAEAVQRNHQQWLDRNLKDKLWVYVEPILAVAL